MKRILLLITLMCYVAVGQIALAQNPGSTFSDPSIVLSLPLLETNMTTCGFGDDYTTVDIACVGNFMSGDDKIYSYTPTKNMPNVQVSMTNIVGNFSGLFVVDDSTSSGNCLGSVTNPSSNDRFITGLNLIAGNTYYIIVSSWANPQCISSFDLQILDQTCPAPANVFASNVLDTGLTLNWTEMAAATQWAIEYGPSGFTQGTGVTIVTSTNPEMINGLVSQNMYDFYVRAICAAPDSSYWVGPLTITMACAPLTDFVDNFDSYPANIIPNCWNAGVFSTDNFSYVRTYQFTTPNSGTRHIRMYNQLDPTAGLFLIYPVVSNLSAGTHRTRFWAKDFDSNPIVVGTMSDPNDSATFTALDTILITAVYTEYTYDFSAYTGTDMYVALKATRINTFDNTYIDDVVWEAVPSCVRPTNLSVAASATSANLAWIENGSATQWEVEHGAAGFSQGTGISGFTGTNPYNVTALSASTSYDFYVRAICGAADSSVWEGPFTFLTPCVSSSTPYLDDVESHATTTNSNIVNCWASNPTLSTNTTRWNVDGSGSTPSTATGPSGAFSGSKYFYLETSNGTNGDVAELYSQVVDVTSLTLPRVQFRYHMYGADINKLVIDVMNAGVWVNGFDSIVGEQQFSNAAAWKQKNIYLPGYTGDVQIRFRGFKGVSFNGDISLDDIEINEAPTCVEPSAFTVSNLTTTSLDLGWFTTATSFEIEYDVAGFTLGTGANNALTTSNPYSVTGLSPASSYDFYVRSWCGVDSSTWSGPFTVTTLCATVTIPYSQNFNTWPLNCWDMTGGSNNWTASIPTGHAEGRYWNLGSGTDMYMTTMDILVNANAQVKFDWSHQFNTTYPLDSMRVDVQVAGSGTWTEIWGNAGANLNSNDGATFNAPGSFVTETIFLDSATYTNQTIKVRFYGRSGFGPDLFVDNFMVEAIPSCFAPDSLIADSVTANLATLYWAETATATQWEVQYGTCGFTLGTGTSTLTSSDSLMLTGLIASSSYGFYVRAICGVADSSTWTGPYCFATGFRAPTSLVCGVGAGGIIFSDDMESNSGWTGDISTLGGDWDFPTAFPGGNSINTGPSGPASGTTYAEFEASGAGASAVATMVTPMIDLSSSTGDAELTFYMHAYGQTMGMLEVGIGTSSTGPFTTVFTHVGEFQTAATDPWAHIGVNLASYLGQQIYVAFTNTHTSTNFYGDRAIDLVQVWACVSCPSPNMLAATNVSDVSADLGWFENGSATQWEMEYGAPGFALGSGTNSLTTSNPVTITGLTSSSSYEFYVRAACGVNDSSSWSGPYIFKTGFRLPTALNCITGGAGIIFSDDMESNSGWTGDISTSAGDWDFPTAFPGGNSTSTGPSGPASGVTYAEFEASGAGATAVATMVTPMIDLSSVTNDAELSFYMHAYGVGMGTLDVGVGTSATGPFTTLFTHSGQFQTSATEPWRQIGVSLTSYVGQQIYVAFTNSHFNTGFYGDRAIDLVQVRGCISCPAPDSVMVSNILGNSVDIDWVQNGSASAWEMEYGMAPYTLGSTTPVSISTNPHNLSGLTSSSNYEFYMRAVCGVGDSSAWTGPYAFTTPCDVVTTFPFTETFENSSASRACWSNEQLVGSSDWSYGAGATGGTINSAYAGASNARFVSNSGNNTPITNLVSPIFDISGLSAPRISFYYAQEMWAGDQNFTRLLYRISANDPWIEIWSDSNEVATWTKVMVNLPSGSATYQIAFQGINNWGRSNVVDEVVIEQSPANDLSVIDVDVTGGVCGLGSDFVMATVVNLGSATQVGFPLGYSFNGVASTPEIITSFLAPGDTIVHTFSTLVSFTAPGMNILEGYSLLAGDANVTNDTTVNQVSKTYLINSFPYLEDFASGMEGWIIDNGTNGTWAFGEPAKTNINSAASDSNAFVTGGLSGNYVANEFSLVNSPCFDFTTLVRPIVQMSVWWESEYGWDGANLQYSTDGGDNWAVLGNFDDGENWYTDASIIGMGNLPAWSGRNGTGTNGGSNGWRTATHEVTMLAGEPDVKFRVAFGSDASIVDEGFAFDDFSIFESATLGNDTVLCTNDTLTLNPGIFDGYLWSDNSITPVYYLDAAILPAGTDTIAVIVSGSGGYKMYDTVVVTIENPEVYLGEDTILCFGESILLDAGTGFSTYLWNDNSTMQTLVTDGSSSGTFDYSVVGITINNCPAYDTVNVSVNTEVLIDLGVDTIFSDSNTQGTSYLLDAGPGFASYLWNDILQTTTQTLLVDSDNDGDISVVVTNISGCEGTDTVFVDFRLSTNPLMVTSLKMYPNPATNRLTIEVNNGIGMDELSVKILDVTGKVVIADKMDDSTHAFSKTYDVSKLATGTYFVQFESNGEVVTKQFVIK